MRIASLSLAGFQCFGPTPVIVSLKNDITALIGGNGSGKTAVLQALCRMFATSAPLRTVTTSDFHIAPHDTLESVEERKFILEAHLEFPELGEPGVAPADTVPQFFRYMTTEGPGVSPHCRLRLEATWSNTDVPGGDIETNFSWVTSPPGVDPEVLTRAAPRERAAIQVYYIPASRDTARQLGNTSGTLLNRLLRAINLGDHVREDIKRVTDELRAVFARIDAVRRIDEANVGYWRELHDEAVYSTPTLQFVASHLAEVLGDTKIVFTPTHLDEGVPHDVDRLSDGQRSLFYFAMINTIFDIERAVHAEHFSASISASPEPTDGPDNEDEAEHPGDSDSPTPFMAYHKLRPAALSIFAFEEPENHLGPHYLGRIVQQIRKLAANPAAQVLMTSHSCSVVSRIEPLSIRHLRCVRRTGESNIRPLTLPPESDVAAKYVREAVRAYPELYFARLVVLGEGDSEEVLLPKFAEAMGSPLDVALVSVVPLGGRHVNHLWRLLNDLDIPHVTLLDLDRERETGGWRTIRYVVGELSAVLKDDALQRLRTVSENGSAAVLDEAAFASLREDFKNRDDADSRLAWWIDHLRQFGVHFAAPLDLDFLMLTAYTAAYTSIPQHGPRGMTGPGVDARIQQSIGAVLGPGATGATYAPNDRALFPWYSLLFHDYGKPSTHTAAWVNIERNEVVPNMPEPLRELLADVERRIGVSDVASAATSGGTADTLA